MTEKHPSVAWWRPGGTWNGGETRRPRQDRRRGRSQQFEGVFGNLGMDRSPGRGEKSSVAFGVPGWLGRAISHVRENTRRGGAEKASLLRG